jgi:hypothetical protein
MNVIIVFWDVELCNVLSWLLNDAVKSKAIPVAGCGGLQGCVILTIPHCADNRPTDGGKVVSPTHWLRSTPRNINFLLPVLISVRG